MGAVRKEQKESPLPKMWTPLMPLNTVLFPGMPMPLAIFEPRYLRMVKECVAQGSRFGVALIREGPEVGGIARPHDVGTLARIVHVKPNTSFEAEALDIVVVGDQRFRINALQADGDLLQGDLSVIESDPRAERVSRELCEEMSEMLQAHVRTVMNLLGLPPEDMTIPEEPERLSFMIAAHVAAPLDQRQELLEMELVSERLLRERDLLRQEITQYRILLASMKQADTGPQESASGDRPAFSRN